MDINKDMYLVSETLSSILWWRFEKYQRCDGRYLVPSRMYGLTISV
jgi:hypothetical protein